MDNEFKAEVKIYDRYTIASKSFGDYGKIQVTSPICIQRDAMLPIRSNQKMNAYLKEIATLCNIDATLNTHKARRTFASTVTLNNGVPISIVKQCWDIVQ